MKLVTNLFGLPFVEDLGKLDTFYRDTVSCLNHRARKQYCLNLIGRLQDDLYRCQCKVQHRHLKKYIRAAGKEIRKLEV